MKPEPLQILILANGHTRRLLDNPEGKLAIALDQIAYLRNEINAVCLALTPLLKAPNDVAERAQKRLYDALAMTDTSSRIEQELPAHDDKPEVHTIRYRVAADATSGIEIYNEDDRVIATIPAGPHASEWAHAICGRFNRASGKPIIC